MKIVHLSDLHLGKQLNGFSMVADQKYILERILSALRKEKPQAIIIAGDVYDKSVPSAEAVTVFDDFLNQLVALEGDPHVFIISGNHDSAERLAFANRLIARSGVHLSPVFDGTVNSVTMQDEFGEVAFHLLPFIKPSDAKNAYPDAKIESYTDAVRETIARINLDGSRRNVLIAHQFVTGAERSESEDVVVGGLDNVDAGVFTGFDYVALGHLHRPQSVPGCENIRYCGTPLKYSFSEISHRKSVTVAELGAKGTLIIREIPLTPMYDLREIRGTYDELTLLANYQNTATDDYLHVVLTDEDDVPDAMAKLRIIYPNLMKLDYDNTRTRADSIIAEAAEIERKSEIELLDALFQTQNGQPMTDEQRQYAEALFEKIREEMP